MMLKLMEMVLSPVVASVNVPEYNYKDQIGSKWVLVSQPPVDLCHFDASLTWKNLLKWKAYTRKNKHLVLSAIAK
jgi:hypothetical protein